MSLKRIGWQPLAVGLAVWTFLAIFSSAAWAEKTASISGYVYLDFNANNILDNDVDFAIRFAKVTLKRDGDPNFYLEAITDAAGFYRFENINTGGAGLFTLSQCAYTCVDGYDNAGYLYDQNKSLVSSQYFGTSHNAAGDPLKGQITGIYLSDGFKGENYNFGDRSYPLELVTKRMFMDLGTPQRIQPIPEPAAWILLLMGGAVAAVMVRRRRTA